MDDNLKETLRYSNSKELYVVMWNGLLKKYFCPFKVRVNENVGELQKGQIVFVDGIKVTRTLKTVFEIQGNFYFYEHFDILTQ